MSEHYNLSTEDKFKTLYQERRKLYDDGKDISYSTSTKKHFYRLAEAFNKMDLWSLIEEIKYLAETESKKLPFAMSSINKIEKQLTKQTEVNKSARWQLLMMMCDWMDVLMDKSPRPKQPRTKLFTKILKVEETKNYGNIYDELIEEI